MSYWWERVGSWGMSTSEPRARRGGNGAGQGRCHRMCLAHREGVEFLPEVLGDALPRKASCPALIFHPLEGQVHQAQPDRPEVNLIRLQWPARSVLLTHGQLQVQRRHHDALVVCITSGSNELHEAELVVRTAHATRCLDEGGLDRQGGS
eukprot:2638913-Prymnesium_polylepis.1